MASRNFNKKQALEKEIKTLYAKVTIGAAGSPTLTSGVGISSIARSAQGDYLITLQDKYVSLKCVEGILLKSTGEDIRVQLKAEAVASAATLSIFTLTGANATDPSSGAILFLKIELKNTSAV